MRNWKQISRPLTGMPLVESTNQVTSSSSSSLYRDELINVSGIIFLEIEYPSDPFSGWDWDPPNSGYKNLQHRRSTTTRCDYCAAAAAVVATWPAAAQQNVQVE